MSGKARSRAVIAAVVLSALALAWMVFNDMVKMWAYRLLKARGFYGT